MTNLVVYFVWKERWLEMHIYTDSVSTRLVSYSGTLKE